MICISLQEVVHIRLSIKIVLIFTVVMLAALFLFSSFAARTTVDGANAFTAMRFRDMSTLIRRVMEQEYSMMVMVLDELADDTRFMAALNQVVRDDTGDQKVGKAAEKIAVQRLLASPLVENYYRVSFYTRDGIFLSSSASKDSMLTSRTDQMRSVIASLPWLDKADQSDDPLIIPTTRDYFSHNPSDRVYGITRSISYRGKPIGYLSVADRYERLEELLKYLDEPNICVEVVFDDGSLLFRNQELAWTWPEDLPTDTIATLNAGNDGSSRIVYYTRLDDLNLNLYISQNGAVTASGRSVLRSSIFRRAILILVPAVILIIFISLGLTDSIRKLTRKVRHINADSVIQKTGEDTAALLAPVTHPMDKEIHTLEDVFDRLMLRLRESSANELSLREGTLQAQLSALQTQINPHFIYNTLNIISAKSMESGNYDVIEICDQFAGMLRYSTDTRSRTATMAEEIENVRNYLMLAKARYEENLEFSIDVPENLNTVTVPKLTLQPLVENAMTHGYDGTNVIRKLSVTGEIRGVQLVLEIRDNGNGFSDEMLKSLRERIREIDAGKVTIEESGGHIGLLNTCLRLHYYSQGKMRMSIRNDHGAVITLFLPFGDR